MNLWIDFIFFFLFYFFITKKLKMQKIQLKNKKGLILNFAFYYRHFHPKKVTLLPKITKKKSDKKNFFKITGLPNADYRY